jgi:hypothetical protein
VAALDILSIVEAAYDLDRDSKSWLGAIADAAGKVVSESVGTLTCSYAVVEGNRLLFYDEGVSGLSAEAVATHRAGAQSLTPDVVETTYKRHVSGTTSQVFGANVHGVFRRVMSSFGIQDAVGINGFNLSGRSCLLMAFLPKTRALARGEHEWSSRVARHLAAAARLRSMPLDADGVEAVLSPSGKLEHAEGEARDRTCREVLRSAVLEVDRARTRTRRLDVEGALGAWRVLVESRWSLIDRFESDGRRYVVARINPSVSAGADSLTPRERQVAALTDLGHSSKVIAYELGISDSTVRVLLSRIRRKQTGPTSSGE